MRKNARGYIYIPFLILILVAFSFVLSGGFILSKKSSLTNGNNEQYTLIETGSSPNQTLQILTLMGQVIPTPTLPIPTPNTNVPLPTTPVTIPTTSTAIPTTGGCTPNPAENCAFYGLSPDQTPCVVDKATSCGAIRCYERPCVPTTGSCIKKTCADYGLSTNYSCSSDPQSDGCGGGISCYNCSIPTLTPTRPTTPTPTLPMPTESYQ